MHWGCFVWTLTPPLSGRRTPRPGPARVCVCMPCLAGSGGPASRARSGAPHLSSGRSGCALCLFGPLRAGVAPFVVVVGFFFPFPPLVAPPLCPALRVFRPRVPWALASCFPPPFFFPAPPSLRPRCLLPCVFSGPGCLGPGRHVAPPPSFCSPPPLSLAFPVFQPRVPWASAPCPPPPFFFLSFVSCFFFIRFFSPFFFCRLLGVPVCASVVLSRSLLCVRWLVLCGVCCWAWLSSAVSWWVLVSCFGGAVLVWPCGSPPCGLAWCVLVFRCPVLCSVALCCRVVVCCGALPFVCVVACACCLFLGAARLLCVFCVCSGVSCCVFPILPALCGALLHCAGALSLCCARRLCCFWWLVLLVPGVAAFCWGSAGVNFSFAIGFCVLLKKKQSMDSDCHGSFGTGMYWERPLAPA